MPNPRLVNRIFGDPNAEERMQIAERREQRAESRDERAAQMQEFDVKIKAMQADISKAHLDLELEKFKNQRDIELNAIKEQREKLQQAAKLNDALVNIDPRSPNARQEFLRAQAMYPEGVKHDRVSKQIEGMEKDIDFYRNKHEELDKFVLQKEAETGVKVPRDANGIPDFEAHKKSVFEDQLKKGQTIAAQTKQELSSVQTTEKGGINFHLKSTQQTPAEQAQWMANINEATGAKFKDLLAKEKAYKTEEGGFYRLGRPPMIVEGGKQTIDPKKVGTKDDLSVLVPKAMWDERPGAVPQNVPRGTTDVPQTPEIVTYGDKRYEVDHSSKKVLREVTE